MLQTTAIRISILIVVLVFSREALMYRNSYYKSNNTPLCSITVANKSIGSAQCNLAARHGCCAGVQCLPEGDEEYPYQIHNNSTISFKLKPQRKQVFYFARDCSNITRHFCMEIKINISIELENATEKIAQISNLPNLFGGNEGDERAVLRETEEFASEIKGTNEDVKDCDALSKTRLSQDTRRDSVQLVADPSPGLTKILKVELVKLSCFTQCYGDLTRNCRFEVVEKKLWKQIDEPILFTNLVFDAYYCIVVRYCQHLRCAITPGTFRHRSLNKDLVAQGDTAPINMETVTQVIACLCYGMTILTVVLVGGMVIKAARSDRGLNWKHPLLRTNTSTVSLTDTQSGGPNQPTIPPTSLNQSRRIFLLYSQDSPELLYCMQEFAKVLKTATNIEVIDPLNNLWGESKEDSQNLVDFRDTGLALWFSALMSSDCSVIVVMTPAGKIRQEALLKSHDDVVFDPPKMTDQLFPMGLHYICTRRANDYNNVFKIRDSFQTSEDQLAQELFSSCDAFSHALARFTRNLDNLRALYAKNPAYTDRKIIKISKT